MKRAVDAVVRRAALSLTLCAGLASTGCTFVGATIGSCIPKYEPLPDAPVANRSSAGDDVEVQARSSPEPLTGTYGGTYDERLWVDESGRSRSVPPADVKQAKIRQGDHFWEGLLIGAAVDITALALFASRAGDFLPDLGGSYHVGADGVDVKSR